MEIRCKFCRKLFLPTCKKNEFCKRASCRRKRRQSYVRRCMRKARKRKDKSLCSKYGCKNGRGKGLLCVICLKVARQTREQAKQEHVLSGVCIKCWEPPVDGRTMCVRHLEKNASNARRVRIRKAERDVRTSEARGMANLCSL